MEATTPHDLRQGRQTETLPESKIPTRKVFLSRKTSFPVFSQDVGDAWLQLLNLALKIGSDKETRDGERFAEVLNTVVTVGLPVVAEDLEVEELPVSKTHADHLDFTPEEFDQYFLGLTDSTPSEHVSPSSVRDARLHELGGFDQIESVCEQLEDADANAMLFFTPTAPDRTPGVLSGSFDVTDGALYSSFVFRSCDIYADWPIEAMALQRLHARVAERLGVEAGAITYMVHAARLSARDWERAQSLLAEHFVRPLPLQVDPSGVFLFGNDGGKARAMLLDHDAGTIFWEEAFDTPQELSWYIVDAMPWLLPQHIRYVGQECSTLTRAMEESVCYLQG